MRARLRRLRTLIRELRAIRRRHRAELDAIIADARQARDEWRQRLNDERREVAEINRTLREIADGAR